jgi:hypothetical protein
MLLIRLLILVGIALLSSCAATVSSPYGAAAPIVRAGGILRIPVEPVDEAWLTRSDGDERIAIERDVAVEGALWRLPLELAPGNYVLHRQAVSAPAASCADTVPIVVVAHRDMDSVRNACGEACSPPGL